MIQCDSCINDAHKYVFWGIRDEQRANLCRQHLQEMWDKWGSNPDLPWTFVAPKEYR